jgi:ribose 5-phosphate isomerase A
MNDKQLVAIEAAKHVENGMLVGLGTGSTADLFIEELARRMKDDKLKCKVVSSSAASARKAGDLGLQLVEMADISHLDLYVDGADEVTPDLTLLKGRGADLVKEKLLAKAAGQFFVLIDQSKLVSRIGEKYPIPVEVPPFSWQLVKHGLENAGGKVVLRKKDDQPAVSSHGSWILDVTFEPRLDAATLDDLLNSTPGVVEHGIFRGLARGVFMAENGSITQRWA